MPIIVRLIFAGFILNCLKIEYAGAKKILKFGI